MIFNGNAATYKISRNFLDMLKSYSADSYRYVEIDGKKSEYKPVSCVYRFFLLCISMIRHCLARKLRLFCLKTILQFFMLSN